MLQFSKMALESETGLYHSCTQERLHAPSVLRSLLPRVLGTPDTPAQDWDSAYLLLLSKELQKRGFLVPEESLQNERAHHNKNHPVRMARGGIFKSTVARPSAVPEDADWVFLGVPCDLGSSKPGAASGPEIIRDRTRSLLFRSDCPGGLYSIRDGSFPLGSGKYFDIGDIFLERAGIDDWLSSVSQVIESLPDHVPVMLLGGDHTFSLPAILSARKRVGAPLSVIHFDSHLDLQVWASTYAQSSGQSFLLDPPVHSNFMSHVLTGAPDTKLYQMGVRNYQTIPSASAGAMREYLQRSSKIFTDQDFHHSDPLEFLSSIPLGSPVYVSMDIDCLSAPFAPATGHPSALGMIPRDLMRSLNFIRKHFRVVGADLMEVSKSADRGGELRTAELGMTALLALVGSP